MITSYPLGDIARGREGAKRVAGAPFRPCAIVCKQTEAFERFFLANVLFLLKDLLLIVRIERLLYVYLCWRLKVSYS